MLASHYTKEILKHQGVNVKNIKETEETIEIYIEKPRDRHTCPVCGRNTEKIHDYRVQVIKELPAFGKKVHLILRKRRYRCECGKRFYEETEIVARYQRMTAKYILTMLNKLHETYSYSSVAREFDVSTTTVIRYFNKIQYNKPKELPEAIGIDEFKGNTGGEKFNCILTDLTNGKVFDILRTRYQHDLIDYLNSTARKNVLRSSILSAICIQPMPKSQRRIFPMPNTSPTSIIGYGRLYGRLKRCVKKYNSIYLQSSESISSIPDGCCLSIGTSSLMTINGVSM